MYYKSIAKRPDASVPFFAALVPLFGTVRIKMVLFSRKVLPQVDILVIDFKQRRL